MNYDNVTTKNDLVIEQLDFAQAGINSDEIPDSAISGIAISGYAASGSLDIDIWRTTEL